MCWPSSGAGVERDTILETVRPTVMWKNRLVQLGEVVVGTPVGSGRKLHEQGDHRLRHRPGNTNSTIAVVAGTATEIIKNNLESEITPSAIYISREGISGSAERPVKDGRRARRRGRGARVQATHGDGV